MPQLVSSATTTLEAGLFDYLTRQGDYAGHAARLFVRPIHIDGMTLRHRNDARRELLSRIGAHVYLDRRPQDCRSDLSVVIRWINGTHEYGLAGEESCSEAFLELTVYASGIDAARRGGTVYSLLHTALSGYNAGYWGDVLIAECLVDAARTLASPPADASDQWTFTRKMNLSAYYYAANSPVYSAQPLTAIITGQSTGVALQLDATQSIAAEGVPLSSAIWQVRLGADSAPVVTVSGNLGAVPTVAGVTGLCNAPSIAFSTYPSLLSATVYVTLILTDVNGTTSTAVTLFST